jgi:hypothetical protein
MAGMDKNKILNLIWCKINSRLECIGSYEEAGESHKFTAIENIEPRQYHTGCTCLVSGLGNSLRHDC